MTTYSSLNLAKAIKKVYQFLNVNYSQYLPLDLLDKDEVTLEEIFPPEIIPQLEGHLSQVDFDDSDGNDLLFSKNFDFEKDNRGVAQIKYGQEKLAHLVKDLIIANPSSTVLSLGIGDGKTASLYSSALDTEGKIIGIDLHQDFLDKAKTLIPSLKDIVFDLNKTSKDKKIPLEDTSVDIVGCAMTAHHIKDGSSEL